MLERLVTSWQALDLSRKPVARPMFRQMTKEKTQLGRHLTGHRDVTGSDAATDRDMKRSKSQPHVRESIGKRTLRPLPSKDSLSPQQVTTLYQARCTDLEIPLIPEQSVKFQDYCARNIGKRRLFLEEMGMGRNAAAVVADVLRRSADFAYVYVGNNPLGDEGVRMLIEAVKETNSVVHIGVNSVCLSSERSCALFEALTAHPSIASIDCSTTNGTYKNTLSPQALTSLRHFLLSTPLIYSLNLSGTGFGNDGADLLASALSSTLSLHWLDISNNNITGKSWEPLCKSLGNSKVKHLSISENRLNTLAVEFIGKMIASQYGRCPIITLNIAKCDLNPYTVKKLLPSFSQNPFIKRINFEQNPFSSTEIMEMYQFLQDTYSLEELNLKGCGLGGEGIETLAAGLGRNKTILRVDLEGNGFGDLGAQAIAMALERNVTLKYVDLSSNSISSQGIQALVLSLASNRSLETLLLTNNAITDSSAKSLAQLIKRNRSLTTVSLHSNPIKPASFEAIRRSVTLNRIKKTRNLTPLLRNEVKKLNISENVFEEIEKNWEKKKEETEEVRKLLEIQQKRSVRIENEENNRLNELQKELETWKSEAKSKENELETIKTTSQNGTFYPENALFESEYTQIEDKISDLDSEIRKLSKELQRLKTNFSLKRSQMTVKLSQMQEILEEVRKRRDMAGMSLRSMQEGIAVEGNEQGEEGEAGEVKREKRKKRRKKKE